MVDRMSLVECLLRSAAADKGREVYMPSATKASFLRTTVDQEIFAVKNFSHSCHYIIITDFRFKVVVRFSWSTPAL